ncbi:DUF86 domain-containing protein [Devosia sp. Root635]|uniref:HepT-like ribonuclease domain-containing protein n=1 Tax=Devosia sp. Root635 TaxID=1736575 RepID=UPI0006FF9919|nr:HepT-like ribonuclease domain-containing protein [Devosia sp. Root635]KRA48322.1 hypothetical protein ASD80_17430 [Devosia sp. Root635]
MPVSVRERLDHISQAIAEIRTILDGRTVEDIKTNRVLRLAFERLLEIISEASRYVPNDLREKYGQQIPWQQVADIGNLVRHVYHRTSTQALWDIYQNDLDLLEAAIDAMLAATPPAPPKS